ncbi:MAG: tetratricopeptide repeat protein [Deltaproteobacteria bacterium]|nr:tetratricopeptide repeat protein [Deltaproteobacteria bacterium]
MLALVALSTVGTVEPALGAPTPRERAKEHFERAEIDYRLGRFDEALRDYERAYELSALPGLLFNIGQCHRQLKHWERAISFYESYLRDTKELRNRSLVKELIAECRRELEGENAAKAPPPEAPAPAPTLPAAPAPTITPDLTPDLTPTPAASLAPEESSSLLGKWWLWAIAAGAAVAATSTVLLATSGSEVSGTLGVIDARTK